MCLEVGDHGTDGEDLCQVLLNSIDVSIMRPERHGDVGSTEDPLDTTMFALWSLHFSLVIQDPRAGRHCSQRELEGVAQVPRSP